MGVIQRYFDAFNSGDVAGMLDCLSDNVAHHVNEGQIRTRKALFADFCAHMSRCYAESLTDMVISRRLAVHAPPPNLS